MTRQVWPAIPFNEWEETCSALHLWCQIIGKYRLSHTPWVNHSWHATLYVTPRGLTTGPIPDAGGTISILMDLVDHTLVVDCASGNSSTCSLTDMSVADFYELVRTAIEEVGGTFNIHGIPNELADVTPFARDYCAIRPYYSGAVTRFHQALVLIERVFSRFPHGLSRQGLTCAFVLGLFRHGDHALLRSKCTAPSWWYSKPT